MRVCSVKTRASFAGLAARRLARTTQVRKTPFLGTIFVLKTINLPRQAPDKHRETLAKEEAFRVSHLGASGVKKADADGSAMPLILSSADGAALVVSPLEDFFTSAQTVRQRRRFNSRHCYI